MDEHVVWEHLPMRRRTALVARVLGGNASALGDELPYTDAAVALRLIEQLAAEGRLSALHVHFDLWPHAWSLFLETPISGARGEIHVIGETLGDAVAKGALSLHDVDVDGRYAGTEGHRASSGPSWKRRSATCSLRIDGWRPAGRCRAANWRRAWCASCTVWRPRATRRARRPREQRRIGGDVGAGAGAFRRCSAP